MKGLPTSTGWLWLKQGFALFRRQPGFLTMVVFTNFLFVGLFGQLPVIGPVLSMVFIPAFAMAIMQSCRAIDEGVPITFSLVTSGFRPPAFKPLCKLGLVYLALFALLWAVSSPWIDMAAVQQGSKMHDARALSVVQGSTILAMMLYLLTVSATFLFLSFAPALAYWKAMPTFKAIFYSVFAVFGSLRAFLGLLMALIGVCFVILTVISRFLANSPLLIVAFIWLVLISNLVFQCAMYAAYKQLLGLPDGAAPDA